MVRHLGPAHKGFEAEGIPVELVTSDCGLAASATLGSGKLDLMHDDNNPAPRLAASEADVGVVRPSSWNPQNDTVVIARAVSDIDSIDDLRAGTWLFFRARCARQPRQDA